jgi:hypothetical protein
MFVPILIRIDNPETVAEVECRDGYILRHGETQYRFYSVPHRVFVTYIPGEFLSARFVSV